MPTATDKKWLKGRNKYPSGYCNEYNKPGQHEGTKPRNADGSPMMTCPQWLTCPCVCHQQVDQLFELTGRERVAVPNPDYDPPRHEWIMPEVRNPITGAIASTVGGGIDIEELEGTYAAPSAVPAVPLAQRRTPTGRAARGGLEAQVWDAVSEMLADAVDPITPKAVGESIANKYHIPTPSSGAIAAVWNRWEALDYAKQAKKPVRFVGFTGDGTWEELERKKTSLRIAKRTSASAAKRGFR